MAPFGLRRVPLFKPSCGVIYTCAVHHFCISAILLRISINLRAAPLKHQGRIRSPSNMGSLSDVPICSNSPSKRMKRLTWQHGLSSPSFSSWGTVSGHLSIVAKLCSSLQSSLKAKPVSFSVTNPQQAQQSIALIGLRVLLRLWWIVLQISWWFLIAPVRP